MGPISTFIKNKYTVPPLQTPSLYIVNIDVKSSILIIQLHVSSEQLRSGGGRGLEARPGGVLPAVHGRHAEAGPQVKHRHCYVLLF